MLLFLVANALACGQTTHIWTALHAVDHLPDGPLKTLLSEPEAERALSAEPCFRMAATHR
jgi:hypothetical protein